MPRSNLTGGKHHKKGKKHRGIINTPLNTKVIYAKQNQVYTIVKKKLGGSRLLVACSDGKDRSAIIPGKFFKKIWMNLGDILLCDLNMARDDSICYVIHKYNENDAKILKSQNLINFIPINEENNEDEYQLKDIEVIKIKPQNKLLDIIDSDDDSDNEYSADDIFDEPIEIKEMLEINGL